MNTERYCATLDRLDAVKAIRAIHQAYLQLKACETLDDGTLDPRAAMKALAECLAEAGHVGFR